MVFEVEDWTKTELFLISEYLNQASRGVYLYVLTTEQIYELNLLLKKAERPEFEIFTQVSKIVGSIESLRKLEAYISAPRQSTILSEEHDSIHRY